MKSALFSTLALATCLCLGFSSCKKDDTAAPAITLKGANPMNIEQGGTYTEPGATATDDVDGDLSAQVEISGTVNTAQVGTYTKTYTVSDAAGNTASKDRTVNVNAPAITRDDYLGTYTVTETCPPPYFLNTTPTISAGTGANEIVISLFYYNGGSLTCTVDGTNITVNSGQAPQPASTPVTGSGTMNSAGTAFTINFTFSPSGGSPVNCSGTYTKD